MSTGPSAEYAAYDQTVMVVCVDLSEPASVSEQLSRWSAVLASLRDAVFARVSRDERAALLRKISMQVQSYYNADLTSAPAAPSSSAADPVTGIPSGDSAAPTLSPHIPEVNYGVPVLVVGTKCDLLSRAPLTSAYSALTVDDRLEFAVFLLRSHALTSGASLFLTASAGKSAASVEALQGFVYTRLYGFPLSATPNALASEGSYGLFIPAGYDSADLIATSQTREGRWVSGMKSDEVFAREKRRKEREGKAEVRAVDDATFYKNLKYQLDTNPSAPLTLPQLPSSSSSAAAASGVPSTSSSRSTSRRTTAQSGLSALPSSTSPLPSQPTSPSSKRKTLNPKGQVAVKAFFKSLLQQPAAAAGAGSGGAVLSGTDGAGSSSGSKRSSLTVRKDAEMELKRMSQAAQQAKQDGAAEHKGE